MGRSVWPELIFADEAPRESLSRAVTAGRLRRIARGVDQHSARKLMGDYLRQMTSGDGF